MKEDTNKNNIHYYSGFIPTPDLRYLTDDNIEEVKLIKSKPCDFTNGMWSVAIIQITALSDYDTDLEVIMGSYGFLAVHELNSKYFCMLEDDLDTAKELFGWESGGSTLMAEMLSAEEKIRLLEKLQEDKKLPKDIYIQVDPGNKDFYVDIHTAKDAVFKDNTYHYRFGQNMKEDIWWPSILDNYKIYQMAILSDNIDDDEEDDDKDKVLREYPSPWDDDDELIYNQYWYERGY